MSFVLLIALYYQHCSLHDDAFHQQLRIRLLDAAYATATILGKEYHDHLHEGAVSEQQDLETIARLTEFNNRIRCSFLYSLIQKNGEVILVSSSASEEELQSDSFARYYTPIPDAEKAMLEIFGGKQPQFCEYENRRGRFFAVFLPLKSADGSDYVVGAEISTHLLATEYSAFLRYDRVMDTLLYALFAGILIAFWMITLRKEEEDARLAAQELTQAILDNAMVGIAFVNDKGELVQANHYLSVLFGYEAEEVLGRTTEQFYQSAQDYREFWEAVYPVLAKGEIFEDEALMRRKDDTVLRCNARYRALESDDLSKGFIVCMEDVTDRYDYDHQLRNHSERLQAVNEELGSSWQKLDLALESAELGIWDWRPQSEEFFTDDIFLAKLGYPPDAPFPDTTKKWLSMVHPDDLDTMMKILKSFIERDDSIYESEHRLKMKNGEWKWIRDVGRVVQRDDEGRALRFIGVHIDIDETKRLHLELMAARQKAEAANQAKTLFLANMSHELRTPLNAILGFSRLLAQDISLQAEHQKKLLTINRSGNYLLDLINGVLDLSKIEAGRLIVQLEDFDLYELLENIEEMFRLRTDKKGLQFTTELSDQLPRYVRTDRKKMRQVLINLLGNAVKFTDEGRVTLRLRAGKPADGPDPEGIYLEVEDTGPGMSSWEQEQLFQPFVQTSGGMRKEQGTGLGLSISRSFARLLGGDVTMRSSLGKGSVFLFHLPIQIVNYKPPSRLHRQVLRLASEQPRYRILVCDDQDEFRFLMKEWLQMVGFNIKVACNGREAVEIWQQWRPHFIWMDMRMPIMDGYAATRSIKSEPGGQETIVVALSADAFVQDSEAMLGIGCDDFVSKPCSAEYVFEVMKRHLGVRYVYKDEISAGDGSKDDILRRQRKTADLEGLPPESRELLRKAVTLGDSELLHEALATIQHHDEALATTLRQWTDTYNYERILKLMR